ncbi:oxidoreductase [Catellatospora sp. IY07-71]|uniref:FAD-dependent oxidoreductase n=1 Tax=Catellatospora sp. IY07-71 TaxID=2728827 RepID=UPI001BB3CEFF|nr:NAD(P)/FAD-dependent oxidoreductase [Catellatospora sp. IY07-71]BCJ75369.1 oxidoreductase [Catellatospora sp. IY07-71]
MSELSVMIIGGGIGGLCLAHGLRRAGVAVTVHERTRARTDWLQGYRIHINPHGSRALHAALPPETWQAFLDTVSIDQGGFAFTTEHLDDLLRFSAAELTPEGGPHEQHYGVSRISLREVLLTGLGDVVRHGSEFVRYEVARGRVTAHFADGSTDSADVLVGADGANSRVRRQLLPHAERADTGVLAIAGKHRLDGAALPDVLTRQTNLVIPKDRGSLFTAVWRPDRNLTSRGDRIPAEFLLDNTTPFVLWGFNDAAAAFPRGVEDLDGARLRDVVLERVSGWAPALRDLVAGSDPGTVNAIRLRSATPVGPWETGPVTLLGDAIHNMTPLAGVGANTALRDADLLRRNLTAVAAGEQGLIPALQDYEHRMLDYGFAAVRQSLRNAEQAASANRLGRAAFRAMLRTVAALPPARRRMAARFGR